MIRPRIIIADTDVNYIQSLQIKFIEEFFEKIDLEMITDRKYFDELFSVPQNAELMIVSESLYNSSLKKHNIKNIFLMTESCEAEQTTELNITKIFKYTNIKDIFNEIIGKSSFVSYIGNDVKQEPQLIIVTSAAGGVGKTTVAMGVSVCLANNYKKVLYINSECLQSFQYLLQNKSPITSADIHYGMLKEKESAYYEIRHLIRNEIFSYIPPFKASLLSLGISSDIYTFLARAAIKSKDFDFVVVDTDSIFDNKKAELLNLADKVILVTKQNKMSVLATNLLVANINGINSEKYYFVCNDFDKNKENALISSEISVNYAINEYINHIADYDHLKCSDLDKYNGFQRIAYMFI